MAWQLSLFDPEEPPVDVVPVPAPPAPELAGPDPRQASLFDDHALLRCELDAALDAGDLRQVHRLDRRLREQFAESPAAAVVAALPADLEARPIAEALALLDASGVPPALKDRLRAGLLARLLAMHGAAAVLGACPGRLPSVAAALAAAGSPDAARGAVRDALLAGRELDAREFRFDPELSDLLAEPLQAPWLASLGALRGLWPAPARPDVSEPAALRAEVEPREPADAFWLCLAVARTAGRSEALVHEARRQMRRLSPELHRLALRR